MRTVEEKLALILKGRSDLLAQFAQESSGVRVAQQTQTPVSQEEAPLSMNSSPFRSLVNNSGRTSERASEPSARIAAASSSRQSDVISRVDADKVIQGGASDQTPPKSPFSGLIGRKPVAPVTSPSSVGAPSSGTPPASSSPAEVPDPVAVDPYEVDFPDPDAQDTVVKVAVSARATASVAANPSNPAVQREQALAYDPDEPEVITKSAKGLSAMPRVARPSGAGATLSRKPEVTYSQEQARVIDCDDDVIVVNAFAGAGKTTTAVGFADAHRQERLLYLCLNRANAEEARRRFGSHVDCKTTHQLAWSALRSQVGDRLTRRWKPLLVKDQLGLPSNKMASITMRILQNFWGTSDVEIDERHAQSVKDERRLSEVEFYTGINFARTAWRRMMDPTDRVQMPDDAYLKMFALRGPQLAYDRIIFDEAQDANPVTMQIVAAQERAKLLCIGDRHQSIYQFRGAVNAMDEFSRGGATLMNLTQTWRFGPKIADLANLILSEFKGEKVPIRGMAADGQWDDKQFMMLARTNAELFRMAAHVHGEGIHWIGGAENYRMDLVMDVYHLYSGSRAEIKDVNLQKFDSFVDYKNYADDAADGEARVLSSVVEEFGHGTPDLIKQIFLNEVAHAKDASLVLTTAHKSKGLEHNCVRIADDFDVLQSLEEKLRSDPDASIPAQDINLLYVALTRAKHALSLNEDTRLWLENLDQHRANRSEMLLRSERLRSSLARSLSPH